MNRKMILSSIGLFLSIALLVGAFLIVPKPSQAKAPKAPTIALSMTTLPNASCRPIDLPTNPNLYMTYQACTLSIWINTGYYAQGVTWNVTWTTQLCYKRCQPYPDHSAVIKGYADILYGNTPEDVLFIVPSSPDDGTAIKTTFTFTGPSNSIKVQFQV